MKRFFGIFFFLVGLMSGFHVTAQEKSCIAMVISGSDSRQFWSKMINGAKLAGKELGITVYARGTVHDKDTAGQKFILDSILDNYHCGGVLLAPSDSSRNQDVAHLKTLNIPVIYIDRDTGGERLMSVRTDNEAAGGLAAKKMSELLGGQGKVVLFRMRKGVASTDAREKGFLDEAQKLGLQVIQSGYLGTRVGDATARAEKVLLELSRVDGIFTPNDTTTIGVFRARDILKKHRHVIHIGFDQDTMIISALKQGKIQGYIAQLPFEIGYEATYAIYEAMHGRIPTEDIMVPVLYIDRNSGQ